MPYAMSYDEIVRKTSVYLDDELAERLVQLAREEGTSQAAILRKAVAGYQRKPSPDRNFALSGSGRRIDNDPRSISEIPDEELFEGFGE